MVPDNADKLDPPDKKGILARLGKNLDENKAWRTQQVVDNRFRLLSQLGYGTFGKVYEAIDTMTKQRVAVKIFNGEFENSGYLQELGLLFDKTHPNIVEVLSFGYSRDGKYLVYEFVGGGSLRDLMVRDARLSPESSLAICQQILQGLAFAHRHRVVHRDLKPENILLSQSDWPFTVKLCDFGLAAKCTDKQSLSSSFGSTAYMAPEQFRDDYDHRVDIYALGVLLYEMLFGQRPYRGDAASILYAHQNAELVLPRHGPPSILSILRRALAKEPDQRYQSCQEMAQAIEDAQDFLSADENRSCFSRPLRAQPVVELDWKTKLPFYASCLSITGEGHLAFSGRGRIFVISQQGIVRQLFKLQNAPDLLVEGGRFEKFFGWLENAQLVIWTASDGFTTIELDDELTDQPLRVVFRPQGTHLLVISAHRLFLYDIAGNLQWQAEVSSYGMLPPAAFSRCGDFIWLATEAPKTQLLCLTIAGEQRCRTSAGHHEVTLLGHHDGTVVVGEKNGSKVYSLTPEGFVTEENLLQEELYSLVRVDDDTIVANSINHLELLEPKTLTSKGFINTSDPFDLFFGVIGGFFQVCNLRDHTRIRFSTLRSPSQTSS